ncbi:MAG: hypothetical protein M3P93_02265, partial [Actinomycetota bacterium]|nr:hypothetical protein [Actinomycetota bacterium]
PPLVPIGGAPGADAPTVQTPTQAPARPGSPAADAPTQATPTAGGPTGATPPPTPDADTATVPLTKGGGTEPTQALPVVRRSRPRS